jgi:hypothetical protein
MAERDLLRFALAAGAECLSAGQLEVLATSESPVHPHLAQCPRCQAELALLKSFTASEPLPDEGASVAWISAHLERQRDNIKNTTRGSALGSAGLKVKTGRLANLFGWPTMRWAIPITVAAAAVVIISVTLLRPSKAPELQADLGRQPAIYRSQEVQLVAPIGDVADLPQELRWQPFPGADMYKAAIMEIDYTQLWSTQTRANSIAIPAAVRAKMFPGKPILWQVTALTPQGQVVATSQVQKFVSPRPHLSSDRGQSK